MVHVWVDYDGLMRGSTAEGEHCEIPGLGPVPVAVARRPADGCILKFTVTKGVEITGVAHGGRTIPAHVRTALECRDPTCIVIRRATAATATGVARAAGNGSRPDPAGRRGASVP
jgi:hypothetical protein